MHGNPATNHVRGSTLPQEQWEAMDVFSARMMKGSHIVFGNMIPLECGNDRLVRERGNREAGQEATGLGRVSGAWTKVLSGGMEGRRWKGIMVVKAGSVSRPSSNPDAA